jgi:cyclic pyranopterin phosphate synthase
MVDVSPKDKTRRTARARAEIKLPPPAVEALKNTSSNKKGSPLHSAIIGGILAAKQTPTLIPLCHHIPLDWVDIDIIHADDSDTILIDCRVSAFHHTGVEMEAMVGASISACVVYDMLKAASHGIVIQSIRLMEKTGGKRDFYLNEP